MLHSATTSASGIPERFERQEADKLRQLTTERELALVRPRRARLLGSVARNQLVRCVCLVGPRPTSARSQAPCRRHCSRIPVTPRQAPWIGAQLSTGNAALRKLMFMLRSGSAAGAALQARMQAARERQRAQVPSASAETPRGGGGEPNGPPGSATHPGSRDGSDIRREARPAPGLLQLDLHASRGGAQSAHGQVARPEQSHHRERAQSAREHVSGEPNARARGGAGREQQLQQRGVLEGAGPANREHGLASRHAERAFERRDWREVERSWREADRQRDRDQQRSDRYNEDARIGAEWEHRSAPAGSERAKSALKSPRVHRADNVLVGLSDQIRDARQNGVDDGGQRGVAKRSPSSRSAAVVKEARLSGDQTRTLEAGATGAGGHESAGDDTDRGLAKGSQPHGEKRERRHKVRLQAQAW